MSQNHDCQLDDFTQDADAPEIFECGVCHKRIPAFALDEYRPFFDDDYDEYDEVDGYDRNGAFDGFQVTSDADPGL